MSHQALNSAQVKALLNLTVEDDLHLIWQELIKEGFIERKELALGHYDVFNVTELMRITRLEWCGLVSWVESVRS